MRIRAVLAASSHFAVFCTGYPAHVAYTFAKSPSAAPLLKRYDVFSRS